MRFLQLKFIVGMTVLTTTVLMNSGCDAGKVTVDGGKPADPVIVGHEQNKTTDATPPEGLVSAPNGNPNVLKCDKGSRTMLLMMNNNTYTLGDDGAINSVAFASTSGFVFYADNQALPAMTIADLSKNASNIVVTAAKDDAGNLLRSGMNLQLDVKSFSFTASLTIRTADFKTATVTLVQSDSTDPSAGSTDAFTGCQFSRNDSN